MADEPYYIQTLQLHGFRGFLEPKTFDFSQKRCLALFATNGNGKSSLIDALEFIFSENGTLERLGVRTINNRAGVAALAHNLAEEKGVMPKVSIAFKKGKEVSDGAREAGPGERAQPDCAVVVGGHFSANPIIRGHGLRQFVEDHKSEQRYADVANWLQLGPLVEVQKNLRALRQQVKAAATDTAALKRVNVQLVKETGNSVTTWDIEKILEHVNQEVIAPLDDTLVLGDLDVADAGYITVTDRAEAEATRLGLAGLRQIRKAAAGLYNQTENEDTGEVAIWGAIPIFEAAVADLIKAKTTEANERSKAANAAFQEIWKVAEPLFSEDAASPETCPICATPLADTKAGSEAGIRAHLKTHLGELADYAAAKKALDDATSATTMAHTRLIAVLPGLPTLLGDENDALKLSLTDYLTAIEAWSDGDMPDSGPLTTSLETLLDDLDQQITEIEAKQGDHTYSKAKAKIDQLLGLQTDFVLAERTLAELSVLFVELTEQATIISTEIREKVQALLDTLQTPMNDIYRQIQGAQAVPIRLELPAEEDANQQRLNLVVDFAANRSGVQPSGYLSDSQIHSVALALRLTAIKQFNGAAPIIALDDIVTSYDADHRRRIAGLIATALGDCQVIVATHDERFFNYLKDQLEPKDWHFTRIMRFDPEVGPLFADHKVTDAMIEERWDVGESAANEMRQAEEEWLLGICRGFGVNIRIRSLDKAYSYERSELAAALAGFIRDRGLEPKLVPGVNNSFLTSLQKGEIENFGSHFHDGPYGDGSIGDEKARWEEFKEFRSQFACPKCDRVKFKRPHVLAMPVCAHKGCEAQFEFVVDAAPAAAAEEVT